MAGFQCQEPGIRLLPGTYATTVYQSAAGTTIVGDLSTWEPAPLVLDPCAISYSAQSTLLPFSETLARAPAVFSTMHRLKSASGVRQHTSPRCEREAKFGQAPQAPVNIAEWEHNFRESLSSC